MIAQAIAQRAIRPSMTCQRILEPSVGAGDLLVPCLVQAQRNAGGRPIEVVAVEYDASAIMQAQARVQELALNPMPAITWMHADFCAVASRLRTEAPFDVVIGNPPFVRHARLAMAHRHHMIAALQEAGHPVGAAPNLWIAIIQLCIDLLRPNGRMIMVVPADITSAVMAQHLRVRLSRQFTHVAVIHFQQPPFRDVQQAIAILLAEGKRVADGVPTPITHITYRDVGAWQSNEPPIRTSQYDPSQRTDDPVAILQRMGRFTDPVYHLCDTLAREPMVVSLGTLASVRVGVETGKNDFFIISDAMRRALASESFTIPILGRGAQLSMIRVRIDDIAAYAQRHPAYLLTLAATDETDWSPALRAYIAEGMRQRVHEGYKCRTRTRWFDVPVGDLPDAFLTRRIHMVPGLAVNEAGATATDSFHRVVCADATDPYTLAMMMWNSLTSAWIEGSGRRYGGGVLELMPREAAAIRLPYLQGVMDPERIDQFLRHRQWDRAIEEGDRILLHDHLGLDWATIRLLRSAWITAREERLRQRSRRRAATGTG